eukprot:XP_003725481.1 PREDICTED: uncharacterized protein LOC100892763 [Strongylocentrotus purpuratus]
MTAGLKKSLPKRPQSSAPPKKVPKMKLPLIPNQGYPYQLKMRMRLVVMAMGGVMRGWTSALKGRRRTAAATERIAGNRREPLIIGERGQRNGRSRIKRLYWRCY